MYVIISLSVFANVSICPGFQTVIYINYCLLPSLHAYLSLSVSDLRAQLTDQIKILDSQVEVKQQQLSDLSEFLRRRGDIEAEYARALDKLTERFTHKTKK